MSSAFDILRTLRKLRAGAQAAVRWLSPVLNLRRMSKPTKDDLGEGRKNISFIDNAVVFRPGIVTDLKKDLSDFHRVDPQICHSVDIDYIRKGSNKI